MKGVLVFSLLLTVVVSIIIPLQHVSALEVRTDFSNRHTSASFGDSRICGDHFCVKGEKPKWTQATWGSQRLNSSKIPMAQHGEEIMTQLAQDAKILPMNANAKFSRK